MAFKMKGSHHYGKGNTSPNKFLGKVAKGIGGALKGAVMGKDGKFGIGDVGRLAMGPLGAAAGATGLFAKKDQMQKETKKKEEERNEYGETRAEYIKRMEEMGLRKPDKKKVPTKMYGKKSPTKNYKEGYYKK
jgi:hypothetical protein